MKDDYGRDLDLNLLRVFLVVAEKRSVTAAASHLYLTQPAVSAALGRLQRAIGQPLFARQGRGLTLTARGSRLFAATRPHLRALVEAALTPAAFDPKTSERTFRVGLSDASEAWLLPGLLAALQAEAPRIRLISLQVQFRTVADALLSRAVDAAVTVADELPSSIRREPLFTGSFVCLFDPRHVRVGQKLSEAEYFRREHVVVSYNGDLRGIVEDELKKARRVRCSVSSFANIGAVVDGSALLATVPQIVAEDVLSVRPHLRTARLPFSFALPPVELLWSAADDDDDAGRFVREKIAAVARRAVKAAPR